MSKMKEILIEAAEIYASQKNVSFDDAYEWCANQPVNTIIKIVDENTRASENKPFLDDMTKLIVNTSHEIEVISATYKFDRFWVYDFFIEAMTKGKESLKKESDFNEACKQNMCRHEEV